jgi:PAS domain S-box-containing protein
MNVPEQAEVLELLQYRREAIADHWHRAIAHTSFVPLSFSEVSQRLVALTDRISELLLSDSFVPGQAQEIGETLVQLHYAHPLALGKTQEVLMLELTAGLPAETVAALQPRLATILGEMATGFLERARASVLNEQETIRSALLTARMRVEEALRQSEARFRAVFDNAAIGIGISDVNGRVLESNREMQEMFGYSADEMLGMIVTTEFTHPEDAQADWELYGELVAGQRDHFHIEKRFYRRNGVLIWCHLTVSLVRDSDGRPVFVIAMIQDITERKQAQETIRRLNVDLERRVLERTAQLTALNQELATEIAKRAQIEAERLQLLAGEQAARAEAEAGQQRLAFLAEASGVLTASLDYKVALTNLVHLVVPYLADWCAVDLLDDGAALVRLAVAHVDLAKQELVRELQQHHRPVPDALSGVLQVLHTGQLEFLPEIPDALQSAATSDANTQPILDALRPRSRITVPLVARERTLGAMSFVLSGADRRYTQTDRVLAEDLARRTAIAIDNARLYHEAQQALSARDEFLSVAAHELKTPITTVRGFVELATRQFAREGGPDPQRLERAVRAIDRESLKLSYLVSRLFDIARIEAGQLALELATTDVSRLVREVATSVQLTTTQHSIEVDAPETVSALVDPLRLEQVITNLLSNAIKYSPDGGPIDVEVSTPRVDLLRIAVRDRGLGIPSERRGRLFERFYQTRAGDRIAGLGLGLYISRQIVEAHGGQIEIESPPDVGTRVIVDLPINREGRSEDGGA